MQVACRLVEIALQIRHIFRLPLDDDLSDPENVERPEIPVCGNYEGTFDEALATQALPAQAPEEEAAEAEAEEEALLPPEAPDIADSVLSKCQGCWDIGDFTPPVTAETPACNAYADSTGLDKEKLVPV